MGLFGAHAREIWLAAAFAAVGAAAAWAYFAIMRRSLRHLEAAGRSLGLFVAFLALRMSLFCAALLLALYFGTASLIAYAMTFVLARTLLLRRHSIGCCARSAAVETETGTGRVDSSDAD